DGPGADGLELEQREGPPLLLRARSPRHDRLRREADADAEGGDEARAHAAELDDRDDLHRRGVRRFLVETLALRLLLAARLALGLGEVGVEARLGHVADAE